MIIMRLMGGLGNQLFQYALGRRLALARRTTLRLDASKLLHIRPPRQYRLDPFNIPESRTTAEEVWRVSIPHRTDWYARARNFVEKRRPYYRRSFIEERSLCFDAQILDCPASAYLVGYWQSEKYFGSVAPVLRQDLVLRTPLVGRNAETAAQIQNSTAVSVHVRREDYANDTSTRAYYADCSPEYYRTAANYLLEAGVTAPRFFVFSDDISWARTHITLPGLIDWVDHNGPDCDYEDLRLMNLCQHHIIANSSFSWWGAWLGSNPEKLVVAPQKWLNDPTKNTRDIVPECWIRI